MNPAPHEDTPPQRHWTALIDEMVAGTWVNPETGQALTVPYESIVFEESLEGRAAELVRPLRLGASLALVADEATYEALGRRVARELSASWPVETVILDHAHADMAGVEALAGRLSGVEGVVAVGSGTINDLCKYVTFLDGRRYCVFGTAGSMNGYTSTTASITLPSGLKVSLPAHAPRGFFVDLGVNARAPAFLNAAGYGDCLARSVAQVDWWMSHRLLGTAYWRTPFIMQAEDEDRLHALAPRLPRGEIEPTAVLHRVLTLCGLGVSVTGISNHGSMGEHQVSHYIDCFAGPRHPGTLHGQQVGVAALTMARLQQALLARAEPPRLKATRVDPADMVRRMGEAAAAQCLGEVRQKALDETRAEALNARLAALWPELKRELQPFMIPASELQRLLSAAGGPTTAAELGVPVAFYREAVVHCREMRNRFSFLDLAADAGELEAFADGEV
jgi:glycerol-1-phosphate dehydrogenase [NAD(P)+]